MTGFTEKDGMLEPTFGDPEGETTYSYEHPSKNSIALNRTTPDPFEVERICVAESKLPQGGEGVFAKRDIPRRRLVALYNGVRIGTSSYAAKHMGPSDYRYVWRHVQSIINERVYISPEWTEFV